MKKIFIFALLFIGICNAELGYFLKFMIENLGRETSSVYFPNIDQVKPLSIGSFKVTGINIINLINTVNYDISNDKYTFTVTLSNPKAVIEINNKAYNPEVRIKQFEIKFELSKNLKECYKVSLNWAKIDLDFGFISSFIPEKFLNNDYVIGFLRTLEPLFKTKITDFLKQSPVSILLEQGQININLNKSKQLSIHEDL